MWHDSCLFGEFYFVKLIKHSNKQMHIWEGECTEGQVHTDEKAGYRGVWLSSAVIGEVWPSLLEEGTLELTAEGWERVNQAAREGKSLLTEGQMDCAQGLLLGEVWQFWRSRRPPEGGRVIWLRRCASYEGLSQNVPDVDDWSVCARVCVTVFACDGGSKEGPHQ